VCCWCVLLVRAAGARLWGAGMPFAAGAECPFVPVLGLARGWVGRLLLLVVVMLPVCCLLFWPMRDGSNPLPFSACRHALAPSIRRGKIHVDLNSSVLAIPSWVLTGSKSRRRAVCCIHRHNQTRY